MASPTVKLNSGYDMPSLDDQISAAIVTALQAGYRHIDTAWNYQCEKAVGEGLRQELQGGRIKREDLFITTKTYSVIKNISIKIKSLQKMRCELMTHEADGHFIRFLWNTCHRRAEAAVRESLADLGLDYLDMYLMHFPMAFKERCENEADDVDYLDTWREMEKLVDKGLVRSIGVSNFTIEQLTRLMNAPGIKYRPSYIQIEVHPYFTNSDLVDFCQKEGIVVTAYAPLGRAGVDYWGNKVANILEEPIILEMAAKYKKNPGQVALRWAVQRGMAIVPKSTNPGRLKSNIELFDLELTPEEMAAYFWPEQKSACLHSLLLERLSQLSLAPERRRTKEVTRSGWTGVDNKFVHTTCDIR
ncbi:aldose reductase-like [Pomacea canaliculata]|uniref:aldose reductase-like n=1 Tax=Pomacea canaliculata TaxID=400727 RepID=UPI000D738F99|nr:aldose reductase-like [Pomacea canaliculata]